VFVTIRHLYPRLIHYTKGRSNIEGRLQPCLIGWKWLTGQTIKLTTVQN